MSRALSRKTFMGGAGAAMLGGFVWIVATQGPLAPVGVTVASAHTATLAPTAFGIGSVEARRRYALGPTAAGRVARVLVDQGDRVEAGQLLAEMDPVDLDERLAASQAAARRSASSVAAAQAQLAEATSRLAIAQANAQRYADLRGRGFVSPEAAETRRHEANAAEAAVDAAGASLASARQEAQRTAAEQLGAARQRAQVRLTAPVAGIVTARLVEPGTTVVAGQAVLEVIDPASLWIRARIDQGGSGGLGAGLAAEIVLRSRPAQPLPGRVERVDWVSDAVTEERIVNVAFSVPAGAVGIGELAEVTVRLAPVSRALAVPSAGVKRVDRRDGVWVPEDGRAVFRPVRVGLRSAEGLTQILDGLDAGEQVIVHSQKALAPGMPVRVMPQRSPS